VLAMATTTKAGRLEPGRKQARQRQKDRDLERESFLGCLKRLRVGVQVGPKKGQKGVQKEGPQKGPKTGTKKLAKAPRSS
jgi:hypothetical protein